MPGRILRPAYAAVALAIIIFFVHQPAVLSDEGGGSSWTAVATSGEAFYRPGDGQPSASWRPLTRGTAIAVSGQVKTGPDGEVTLVRGKDTIELSPQTVVEFPPSPSPNRLTRVIQNVGRAFFSVDSIPGRSFKVETPLLVAGVLGTQFVVVATPQGNSVRVDEGRVEVAVLNGAGRSVEIGPGQTANLDSSGQLVVSGSANTQKKGGRGKGDKGNKGGNGNRGGANNGGGNNGGGSNGGANNGAYDVGNIGGKGGNGGGNNGGGNNGGGGNGGGGNNGDGNNGDGNNGDGKSGGKGKNKGKGGGS